MKKVIKHTAAFTIPFLHTNSELVKVFTRLGKKSKQKAPGSPQSY
jgi:hypothetical protein